MIGLLLGLNLLAAHFTRFKVQAKGQRLYVGLGIIVAGLALTIVVVVSGNAADGVRGAQSLSWDAIWQFIRWTTAFIWVGSVFWVLRSADRIKFWTRVAVCTVLGSAAFWLIAYGGSSRISDASLRILWQLIQGPGAGLVLLWGSCSRLSDVAPESL